MTAWLATCTNLVDFRLYMGDSGDEVTGTLDEPFGRFLQAFCRIGKQLMRLGMSLHCNLSTPFLGSAIQNVLRHTPHLRRLQYCSVGTDFMPGMTPLHLADLQHLTELEIDYPLYDLLPSTHMPALQGLKAIQVDYHDLQLLARWFGPSLRWLEVLHLTTWHTPASAAPLLFPALTKFIIGARTPNQPFSTFFHLSTPFTTIVLRYLGNAASDLLTFTSSQNHSTLRRIVVEEPDVDYLDVVKSTVDSAAEPISPHALLALFGLVCHIRLRQLRSWASTRGIQVIAPWYKEELGSNELAEEFSGYELAMDAW